LLRAQFAKPTYLKSAFQAGITIGATQLGDFQFARAHRALSNHRISHGKTSVVLIYLARRSSRAFSSPPKPAVKPDRLGISTLIPFPSIQQESGYIVLRHRPRQHHGYPLPWTSSHAAHLNFFDASIDILNISFNIVNIYFENIQGGTQ
jgi:hypothetical protein